MRTKLKPEYIAAAIFVLITLAGYFFLSRFIDINLQKTSDVPALTATITEEVQFMTPTISLEILTPTLTPIPTQTPAPRNYERTVEVLQKSTWNLVAWYDYSPDLVNDYDFSKIKFLKFEDHYYELVMWLDEGMLSGTIYLQPGPSGAIVNMSMVDNRGGGPYIYGGWIKVNEEGSELTFEIVGYGRLVYELESSSDS